MMVVSGELVCIGVRYCDGNVDMADDVCLDGERYWDCKDGVIELRADDREDIGCR